MTDLDGLVQKAADQLVAGHVGVVVTALTPGSVETRGPGARVARTAARPAPRPCSRSAR
ncbi:hypothetical protein [Streptosporangium roseum]|uniref:hypothetical protein n=1 Tax=Streptosporangium roseum TaxID=2001 RepID=UPI00146F3504|nr:hypothetical protein [Streptosporangium roseum]